MQPLPDITVMLRRWSDGDRAVLDQLMPLVYAQLRKMAHIRMRGERPDHTLNTTGLVNEAYLKLIDLKQAHYEDRAHFFAVASKVMRHILISYARKRQAQKRGGGADLVSLDEERLVPDSYAETLLDLDDLLNRLAEQHPRQAEVIQHHYFAGLTSEEAAEALGVSLRTVERDLKFARAWLARAWREDPSADG